MTVTELVAKLGLKIDEGSFEKGTKTLEGLVKAAKAVTAAFVAQEGFKFMREIATAAMEDAHAVQKMSERFGVGAQELQKLGAAAGDLGIEGVGHAMKFLSTNAYNAAQGTGNAGEAFSRLGVSVRDQNGQMKTADVLMGDIADGMMRIHDPMERTALATKLFGREGSVMVNMLKDGRKGLDELAKARMRYNSTFSAEQLEKAEKMRKAQEGMDAAFKGLRNTIAERLFPIFEVLYKAVDRVVEWFAKAVGHSSVLQIVLVALGVALGWVAVAVIAATWPFILMAAVIAAAILVLDEIVTSFRGGRTYLKDFGVELEKLYDLFMQFGTSNKFLNVLIGSVKVLLGALNAVKGTMYALVMAAMGDFSGFKQVVEQMKVDFAPQIKDAVALGQGAASLGQAAYATASSAAAGASNWMTRQMAPISVHQTINASPGMDETSLADKSADKLQGVLRNQDLEHALHGLTPAVAQ